MYRRVPVEFLSDEFVSGYGRFVGEPSARELSRWGWLDDADRELIGRRRRDVNRLGFAVQLATLRMLGMFLPDPLDVPWPLVVFLADQLGIGDGSVVKGYTERSKTAYEHQWQVRVRGVGHGNDVGGASVRRRAGVGITGGSDATVRAGGRVAAGTQGVAAGCVGPGKVGQRGPR